MSAFEQMSDEEIIAAYRRGEESAIDFICQKYKPLVLKRAKAMFLAGGETDLAFENVCFSYGEDRQILDQVSMEFPAGSFTSIVGPRAAARARRPASSWGGTEAIEAA